MMTSFRKPYSKSKLTPLGLLGTWLVENSDLVAVCGSYYRSAEALAKGEELILTEEEKELKLSALSGVVAGGIGDDLDALNAFCQPIHAYRIGFVCRVWNSPLICTKFTRIGLMLRPS